MENSHGAGDHMVARRSDTRTLLRSLSSTLDLTVKYGDTGTGVPTSERVPCSIAKQN